MAVRSEPPRPSVVSSPASVAPWKPATTTTLPSSRRAGRSPPVMRTMRARVWLPSVTMPAWAPVREMAGTPMACSAITVSAMVSCSPTASSTSISRSSGRLDSALARATSSLVTPLRAETTTTSRWPWDHWAFTLAATFLMRSTLPTDVPPYFWTIRAIGQGAKMRSRVGGSSTVRRRPSSATTRAMSRSLPG